MPDATIIIVNHNTRDLLKACLASLEKGEPSLTLEVIVVDNASTDGSREMVRNDFPSVSLLENAENQGFARPNNVGMRVGAGRYYFLLNSDAEITHGALTELIRFMDSHPEAGACGPKLLYPDGRLQQSVKGFPSLWTHICDMALLDKVFWWFPLFGRGEMRYFRYNETSEVDHVMAAAFLVRREVIDRVGVFDERFFLYYNDMDWCYRMVQSGWKIYYVHSSSVIHHLGRTTSNVNREFAYFSEQHNNVMLFYQKRYGKSGVVLYKIVLLFGFTFRTAGWGLSRIFKPTERTKHMATFSWKTLRLAIRFWSPLPYEVSPQGPIKRTS